MRKAIRDDLKKAGHKHDDSKQSITTATSTSVVEAKLLNCSDKQPLPLPSSSLFPQPCPINTSPITMTTRMTRPNIIVGPTCSTGDETSQSNKDQASKKKSEDWNGTGEEEDDDMLYLGLCVYTKNNILVTIHGQLKPDV